ncbi:MAG TPA: ABC transporter ATP-binding protein [Tepidisphaeraceae bacterium]|nr:ABC transporter ATP-binding protein [Tepidisphaeraceae bacterium]
MPQQIIQFESLSHAYGQRLALADVSLAINAGEIFGFLGPNGSGKTTLFRILSTLIPAPPGKVSVLGMDLAVSCDEVRRHIGVVFQSPSLDRELTAEENLRHHGHLYGLRGQELAHRMDEMLERFDLSDRRHEYVKTFSGGMRRRVELAKGLLTRPQILLMDEPSTGLDPTARIDMWRSLAETRTKDGLTILVTTHLMDEAERCDRLAIMHRGQVVATGTPNQLKEQIGGDVIILTSRDLPALKEALTQKLGIAAEEIDATLRIERPRAHEFVPQLVEAAPGLVESVSVGKPTLEDVFIRATGHRFKDEMDQSRA